MLARWRRTQEEEVVKEKPEKPTEIAEEKTDEKPSIGDDVIASNDNNEASPVNGNGKAGSDAGKSGAGSAASPKPRTVEVAREAALELLSRGLGASVQTEAEEELHAVSTTVPGCSEDVDGPATTTLSRSSTGSPKASMQRRVATLESMIQVRDARLMRLEGELGEASKREEALGSRVAALEEMVAKLCKACGIPPDDTKPCEGSPDSCNTAQPSGILDGASATTDIGTSAAVAVPTERSTAEPQQETPMATETSKAVEESMQAISSAVAGILGASVTDTSALSRSLPSHSATVLTQGRVTVKAPSLVTSRTSPQMLRPGVTTGTTTKVIRAVSPVPSVSTGTRQPIPVSSRVQLPFLGSTSPPVSGLSSTGSLAATARRITVVRSPRAGGAGGMDLSKSASGAISPRLPLGALGGAVSPRSGSPTVIRVIRSPRSSPLHSSRVSKVPPNPTGHPTKVFDLGSSQAGSVSAKDADKAESVASGAGAPADSAHPPPAGRSDYCEDEDSHWTPKC